MAPREGPPRYPAGARNSHQLSPTGGLPSVNVPPLLGLMFICSALPLPFLVFFALSPPKQQDCCLALWGGTHLLPTPHSFFSLLGFWLRAPRVLHSGLSQLKQEPLAQTGTPVSGRRRMYPASLLFVLDTASWLPRPLLFPDATTTLVS